MSYIKQLSKDKLTIFIQGGSKGNFLIYLKVINIHINQGIRVLYKELAHPVFLMK